MNKTTEALKMAIDYLTLAEIELAWNLEKPINACKEALEQPAQEPVVWNEEKFNAISYAYRSCPIHEVEMVSQRYQELVAYVLSLIPTAQPLSDDEIERLADAITIKWHIYDFDMVKFARAIEAHHGIGDKDE